MGEDNSQLMRVFESVVRADPKAIERLQMLPEAIRARYVHLPEDTQRTIGILMGAFIDDVGQRFPQSGAELDGRSQLIADEASQIASGVARFVDKYVQPDSTGGLDDTQARVITYFSSLLASALRTSPGLITNERAQLLIATGLGSIGDLVDVVSEKYYFGPQSDGKAEALIREYSAGVPLGLSLENMLGNPDPVQVLIRDWYAAVHYCQINGVEEKAFLRDGTPLFRFAPNALGYIDDNEEEFPGLSLLKVNEGDHVEQWLRKTLVGKQDGQASHDAWLVLLTGYTPDFNKQIGVYERYSKPLVSTALYLANRR